MKPAAVKPVDMLPHVADDGAVVFEQATPEYTAPAIVPPPVAPAYDLCPICGVYGCPLWERDYAVGAINRMMDSWAFVPANLVPVPPDPFVAEIEELVRGAIADADAMEARMEPEASAELQELVDGLDATRVMIEGARKG